MVLAHFSQFGKRRAGANVTTRLENGVRLLGEEQRLQVLKYRAPDRCPARVLGSRTLGQRVPFCVILALGTLLLFHILKNQIHEINEEGENLKMANQQKPGNPTVFQRINRITWGRRQGVNPHELSNTVFGFMPSTTTWMDLNHIRLRPETRRTLTTYRIPVNEVYLSMYSQAEQISKYIVDNWRQVSFCWRREREIGKWKPTRMSFLRID